MSTTARFFLCITLVVYLSLLGIEGATGAEQDTTVHSYDVVVYGGTSAGVAAAVQVARMGSSVVVIEPGRHLGGMSSSGLGSTDIGNKAAIGGISFEFYRRVYSYYYGGSLDNPGQWKLEPHVAETVFNGFVEEESIPVLFGERLDLDSGVTMDGRRIESIALESGLIITGTVFIDATYEGDLMAKAGVSYHVGRESNSTYGEILNGVQIGRAIHHNFDLAVDPYLWEGDRSSGLLPGIHDSHPGREGSGDRRIQAYNFRLCTTDVPANSRRWGRPAGYDHRRYEILLRYFDAGLTSIPLLIDYGIPNGKTDVNNRNGFSTDNIGMNYDYPEGDYDTREAIIIDHELYQRGLMWTLAYHPRVPLEVRLVVREWGLAEDEFVDNDNWPYQLYVREARRMISDCMMTEHNCRGNIVAPDSIGMASYTMDSHNVQRYVDENGHARNEGDIQVGGFPPYPISYRSIIPSGDECRNLLVPVCLSASHVAYGSIRMEPVFMVLGQSAGTAAVLANEGATSVQDVRYAALRQQLLDDGQVLED